jgi:hypothetical protein
MTKAREKETALLCLLNVGAQLSNVAYNLAQGVVLQSPDRELLKGLAKQWDDARSAHNRATAPKRRKPSGKSGQ